MKHSGFLYLIYISVLWTACSPSVPKDYTDTHTAADIFPEYTDVTVPCNIAPLHFRVETEADAYVTRLSAGHEEWITDERDVCPGISTWRTLVESALGDTIRVDVYTAHGGQWTHHQPFGIAVSKDSVDAYLSYRLIAPSYVTYEDLVINQRCLEDYQEEVLFSNMLVSNERDGMCINCHSYQNYNPDRIQFHGRQAHGGTVIAYDGEVRKVNLKCDSTISAGVYPAWHPTARLIAYSTNKTGQSFHTRDAQKVEVSDTKSDLILYDLERNEVLTVARDSNELEVFPWWSPDGDYLCCCSAHFVPSDSVNIDLDLMLRYQEVKYNLYRKHFALASRTFGPRELVFDAAALGLSATLPRISPDGRYLLFTVGPYGVFHIWHKDANLWMTDLQTAHTRPLTEVNSPDVESYHSWSSNGRWIVFSSRRTDGNFTRPYLAHIDAEGRASKPFELPQDDPQHHRRLMRSYNIPEFMSGPVTLSPQEFARVVKGDAEAAHYISQP